jgi:hypothetical protein
MPFKSADDFRDFDKSVRRELRYVRTAEQEMFVDAVLSTCLTRSATLPKGSVLWRAQLGHDLCPEGDEGIENRCAHPSMRMKPDPDKVTDGRANPRGIAYLYLATLKTTAALEVRPSIGSYVSIAQFKVLRDVQLIDCSADKVGDKVGNLVSYLHSPLTPDQIENINWSDINTAFSEPVERGDSSLDYVSTQILAEVFKRNGFAGLAYRSSYGRSERDGKNGGHNVVLFDMTAADLTDCGLYRVRDVSVELSQEDNPYFIRSDP